MKFVAVFVLITIKKGGASVVVNYCFVFVFFFWFIIFSTRGFDYLITVSFGLVGTVDRDANILGLLIRQDSELGTERFQVKTGDLLIQSLWQNIYLTGGVFATVLLRPQLNLSKGLVREGARHDK